MSQAIQVLRSLQEEGRFFLWVPVFIGVGIGIYFSLAREPSTLVSCLATVVFLVTFLAFACARCFRADFISLIFASLLCTLTGFFACIIRTYAMQTTVAKSPRDLFVAGRILSCQSLLGGDRRLVLEVDTAFAAFREGLPRRIQFRVKQKHAQLPVGAQVSFYGRIFPPSPPSQPHGFDYARTLFFQGIGATGFTLTEPHVTQPAPKRGGLAQLRSAITARIYESSPSGNGPLIAALITGEKLLIDSNTTTALQSSGVAHILAISGLHMSLFCGVAFWLTRAVLALVPAICLRFPVKKWACVVALFSGLFYLGISGCSISTQRSFIMVFSVFSLIFLDRPALSMRILAVAATLLLVLRPESLLSASFQMSFSAVLGLLVLHESRVCVPDDGGRTIVLSILRYVVSVAVASLVAGLFTGPFSAFHFHRLPLYGTVANMAVIPIMSFVVMPAALFSLVLMPIGLEHLGLVVMGWGLKLIKWVAFWVSSWPGSVLAVRQAPLSALVAVTLGGLWCAIFCRRCLWSPGLVVIGVGISLWVVDRRPDILVEPRTGTIGVLDPGTGKRVLTASHPRYVARSWLLADGDARPASWAVGRVKGPEVVRVVLGKQAGVQWPACSPGSGVCALWLDGGGRVRRVESVQGVRGERPWV